MKLRNKHVISFIFFIGFICLFTFCSKKGDSGFQILEENGITIVSNPQTPLHPNGKLVYEEELSIGREEGDTNFVFYRISGVRADKDGNIYVLNSGSYQMRVFDATGNFLYAFGKKGEGPGEFMAQFLNFDMDGQDNLYVFDYQNRRISSFSPKGDLLKEFTFKKNSPRSFSVDANGDLGCSLNLFGKDPQDRKIELKKLNMGGETICEFGTFADTPFQMIRSGQMVISLSTGLEKGPEWLFTKKGLLYFAQKDHYEISVYSAENKLLRKIRKQWTPLPVSSQEKEKIRNQYQNIPGDVKDKITFPDEKPAFDSFIEDDQGNLWVDCPTEFGVEDHVYDVFNPEGKYVYRTTIPFRPNFFRDGKIYVIKRTEDGIETVKRYGYRWGE